MMLMHALDHWFPEEKLLEFITRSERLANANLKLLRSGMVTFVGMAMHNAPEGAAVYWSTLKGNQSKFNHGLERVSSSDTNFGLSLAFAILCHNIPEGMAVAIPLLCSMNGQTSHTGNNWFIIKWTLINGMFEPIAVLICWFFFGSGEIKSADGSDGGFLFRMLASGMNFESMLSTYYLNPFSCWNYGFYIAS